MKQVLGKNLHQLCEQINGNTITKNEKPYKVCYTTRNHFIAECWIDELNADYVRYYPPTKYKVIPAIRNGQRVNSSSELI